MKKCQETKTNTVGMNLRTEERRKDKTIPYKCTYIWRIFKKTTESNIV